MPQAFHFFTINLLKPIYVFYRPIGKQYHFLHWRIYIGVGGAIRPWPPSKISIVVMGTVRQILRLTPVSPRRHALTVALKANWHWQLGNEMCQGNEDVMVLSI